MIDEASTRASLLVRIRDAADHEAWRQFVAIYAPLVYRFATRRGLQDADASDLAQEVLRAVMGAADRLDYDPRKGSFRAWLRAVARHKIADWRARQKRHQAGSGDSGVQGLLDEWPAPADEDSAWEQDYQQRLFLWAVAQVRDSFEPSTWNAFWRTAVEGKSGKQTAAELGLSIAAVYLAKSRVLGRLKKEVQRLREEEG